MDKIVYLDNNATTKMDVRVFEAMKPYFTEVFGNASSKFYKTGQTAGRAVAEAREAVAKCLGA